MTETSRPDRTHARGARCTRRSASALFLNDTAPAFVDMFVARGRAEIDRRHDEVQQRVTTARSLGEVAIAFGPPIVAPARRSARSTRRAGAPRTCSVRRRARRRAADAPLPPTAPTTPSRRPRAGAAPRRRRREPRPPAPAPTATSAGTSNGNAREQRRAADPGLRRAVGVAGRRAAHRARAATSSTRCTRTRPRTGSAARSSARSNSSPDSRTAWSPPERPTADDLPALVELARALRAEMRDQRGGALWATREARPEPLDDDARRRCSDATTRAWSSARSTTSIVGFGTVEIELLRDGTRLGVIGDLFVEPEARAVGVGESIADLIVAFCAGRGLHRDRRVRAARRPRREELLRALGLHRAGARHAPQAVSRDA